MTASSLTEMGQLLFKGYAMPFMDAYLCKMKKNYAVVVCLFLGYWLFIAALAAQPNRDCRVFPRFVQNTGLNMQNVGFSTSDRMRMGLVLNEINPSTTAVLKTYQHPTWKNAGWLGPLVVTEKGEVWVAPVPVINTEKNKPKEQTRLWKVDALSGEMALALELPAPDINVQGQNPYGLLGLGYDCDNQVLYASSVSGSTMDAERGVVYAIRSHDRVVISKLEAVDVFGVGLGVVRGVKRLYFGKARSTDIYSIALNTDGSFSGQPRFELSLNDLGPRGDDRARKIRFAQDGTLTIHGLEFYFNLTAPTEKQETVYQFRYNESQQKWVLTGIQ
jgi:hypothetical protein